MQHKNSDSWQLAPRGRTEAGDEWLVNKDLCVELKGDDTRTWLTESELKMLLAAVRKRDTGNSTGLMEGFMHKFKTPSGHTWSVCTDGHVHVETNEGTLCLDSLDVLAMDAMLSDSDPQLKDSKCDLRPTHNL